MWDSTEKIKARPLDKWLNVEILRCRSSSKRFVCSLEFSHRNLSCLIKLDRCKFSVFFGKTCFLFFREIRLGRFSVSLYWVKRTTEQEKSSKLFELSDERRGSNRERELSENFLVETFPAPADITTHAIYNFPPFLFRPSAPSGGKPPSGKSSEPITYRPSLKRHWPSRTASLIGPRINPTRILLLLHFWRKIYRCFRVEKKIHNKFQIFFRHN